MDAAYILKMQKMLMETKIYKRVSNCPCLHMLHMGLNACIKVLLQILRWKASIKFNHIRIRWKSFQAKFLTSDTCQSFHPIQQHVVWQKLVEPNTVGWYVLVMICNSTCWYLHSLVMRPTKFSLNNISGHYRKCGGCCCCCWTKCCHAVVKTASLVAF